MSYIIVVVLVIFGLAGIRIADQYVRGVVFRLGRYHTTKGPGVYWIIPLIEWQRRVDLRINTAAVEQQETITKDNVPIKVNAVVWYRIVNPHGVGPGSQEHRHRRDPGGADHVAHRHRPAFARRSPQGAGSRREGHTGERSTR